MLDKAVETFTIGQVVQTIMGYATPLLVVGVIVYCVWYYRSLAVGAFNGVRSFVGGLFTRNRTRTTVAVDGVLTFEEASSYAKALADYHKAKGCDEGYQAALKAGQCLFAEGKADAAPK